MTTRRRILLFLHSTRSTLGLTSLCLFFLLLVLLHCTEASFVLTIPSHDESCFVLRAPPNSVVSGNFDLLDDNLSPMPVSVTMLDSNLKQLYHSRKGVTEDTFQVKASGRLSLCVQNGLYARSDGMERSVGVALRVRQQSEMDQQVQEASERLVDLSENVINRLMDLENHQDYLRNREAAHREVTEQTFTHIVRWTVLEAVVLALVAMGQIMYLRKFFETKRYM